jgi:MOSC domain-containing protein YiiM
MEQPLVIAVSSSATHSMAKPRREIIQLLAGLGVEGDAHCGETVKHRSRVAQDPTQPNLRQVHLVQAELFDELAQQGFTITSGQIGENITTRHIDLLALPRHTILTIGLAVRIKITGLRNPCKQLDGIQDGLMNAVLDKEDGQLIRKAGIMGIVEVGGPIRAGDAISVTLPDLPHEKLERV